MPSTTGHLPAKPGQIDYLRHLYEKHGYPFAMPPDRMAAARRIACFKKYSQPYPPKRPSP